MYAALYDMQIAMQTYGTPDAAGDEATRRGAVFRDAANTFRAKFQHARFWFDEQTCELLDQIWEQHKEAGYALDDRQSGIDFAENGRRARSFIKTKIPELRTMLERDMRRIISGL